MRATARIWATVLTTAAFVLSGYTLPAMADEVATPAPSSSASATATTAPQEEEKVAAAVAEEEPSASEPSETASASASPSATATPSASPTTATPKPTATPTKPPATTPPKPPAKTVAPQIWGHRGGGPGVRDNSIAAIRAGIASSSVAVLEFDMHMTKNHVWVLNHDATACGKTIRKTTYSKLKNCVTTFNSMTSTVRGKKPVQLEIKPGSITCTQSLKVYRQARKMGVNIQWSSFKGSVLNKMYSCVKKEYNKKKYRHKYGSGFGTKLANQMKFALIVRSCVSASTLNKYHARTVDLRYYKVGSSKTNLGCVASLVKAGKAVALWTFKTSATMYAEAAKVRATAVITDDAGYASTHAYPATKFTRPRTLLR